MSNRIQNRAILAAICSMLPIADKAEDKKVEGYTPTKGMPLDKFADLFRAELLKQHPNTPPEVMNKLFTKNLISRYVKQEKQLALQEGLPVLVDSKKGAGGGFYRGLVHRNEVKQKILTPREAGCKLAGRPIVQHKGEDNQVTVVDLAKLAVDRLFDKMCYTEIVRTVAEANHSDLTKLSSGIIQRCASALGSVYRMSKKDIMDNPPKPIEGSTGGRAVQYTEEDGADFVF